MALGLKTGPRAEKCYFTPANSVLKFNFTPARAKITLVALRSILRQKLNIKQLCQNLWGKEYKLTCTITTQTNHN
jgi:hypothetical protein